MINFNINLKICAKIIRINIVTRPVGKWQFATFVQGVAKRIIITTRPVGKWQFVTFVQGVAKRIIMIARPVGKCL